MRHRKHGSKLNRTSEHRVAMLRNLTIALLTHDRIRTTKAKAQNLRPFVEKLVTLARDGSLASRRLAISRLNDAAAVHQLFEEVGPRMAQREGGYLRIVNDGPRAGDGAPMAYVEFVDPRPADSERKTVSLEKRVRQKRHQARKERQKAMKDMG